MSSLLIAHHLLRFSFLKTLLFWLLVVNSLNFKQTESFRLRASCNKVVLREREAGIFFKFGIANIYLRLKGSNFLVIKIIFK